MIKKFWRFLLFKKNGEKKKPLPNIFLFSGPAGVYPKPIRGI